MRLMIVLFALGVWFLQRSAELPDMRGAWLVLPLLLAAVLALRFQHRPYVQVCRTAALAATAGLAGFFWAAALAHVRMADALPAEWQGRDIELIGVVASLPQPYERSIRFEFDVESVSPPEARVPQRIVLSWWGRAGALPAARAGERWRFVVRLKRPHGTVNPGGFDYERWLLERDIRATGYVRGRSGPERLAALVHRPHYWVQALRERLRERILSALAGRPCAGIIVALAVGDQRAIPAAQWETFTRTGVNHLMSISGLHVTMVSGLVYAAVLFGWRRSARLTLRVPAAKAAALFGVLAAFAYTLLAGFAVPAQRTLYMVMVVGVALWTGVPASASVVLAIALLIVLVADPWAIGSAGFWLSFGAVAAILMTVVNRVSRPGWLVSWGRTQAAVTVVLLPLLLGLFQQVSLVSPVANAFAIPVVSLAVAPLALAGMMLPFDGVLQLAHALTAGCMRALEWLSALPESTWEQHAPVPWTIVSGIAGALWLMLPRGMPGRWLGLVACLPLFLVRPPTVLQGSLQLTVLDVGQGLAVVARTAKHALVYDTGPAFGPASDSGNRIVAPYLRGLGVSRIDGMVISHDNADHTGGAVSLLQAVPVRWLASSLPDMDPLPLMVDDAMRCGAGQQWTWDDVTFEVLYPDFTTEENRRSDNDASCVVRIVARGGTVLLPGDIEKRAEAQLLANGGDLTADVLIAPHHGSKTSSTHAFIEAVNPRAVIFSAGYRNRFGHPHPSVVERFQTLAKEVRRTDADGAVTVTIADNSPLRIEPARATYRRYWLDAPLR